MKRGTTLTTLRPKPAFVRVGDRRLRDLWGSFDEWSAYGVEVPLTLDDEDHEVFYYVLFLSGIQVFKSADAARAAAATPATSGGRRDAARRRARTRF